MNNMLKAALISGLILGLLSGVPIISLGNILCCMWVILGGLLAVFFYKKFSKEKIELGKGALVGLYSGLIGAPIATIISTIFSFILQTAMNSMMSTLGQRTGTETLPILGSELSLISIVIGLLFNLVIFSIFGVLGGIIGAATFGKK